jgi:hypothetical protein
MEVGWFGAVIDELVFMAPRRFVWNAAVSFRSRARKWMSRQMLELGHSQVSDGDEVGCRSEAPRCTFGLLQQTVH